MQFQCERYPNLVIWDGQKEEAAASFENGRLETKDERAIELVRAAAEANQITEVKNGTQDREERVGNDVEHAEAQTGGGHDSEDERVPGNEPADAPGQEVKIGDLRRQAKELGINSFGLKKEELIKAIAEKQVT